MKVIASSSNGAAPPAEIRYSVQKSVYSLNAVKKTALKFTDTCVFDFNEDSDSIHITIQVNSNLLDEDKAKLLDRFKIELLDQDLRDTIARESEPVRNLILANVFSKVVEVEDTDESL